MKPKHPTKDRKFVLDKDDIWHYCERKRTKKDDKPWICKPITEKEHIYFLRKIMKEYDELDV